MKKKISTLILSFLMTGTSLLLAQPHRQLFNDGWAFRLDNTEQWRTINLPHDWSIEGSIDSTNVMGNDGGYYPDGIGYYRKTLHINESQQGRNIALYFEGSYMKSTIYLNGDSIACHNYGYTSFYVDLTPHLRFGADNQLLVKVDNSMQKNCRWYSGSGIFRNVWLYQTDAAHFGFWSTFITTPTVTEAEATVALTTSICNDGDNLRNLVFKAELQDGTMAEASLALQPHQTSEVKLEMLVCNPQLWSPDSPDLYTAQLTLFEAGKAIDWQSETFGIRTIEYTVDRGFLLNGQPTTVFGGCVHHDNGLLGAAAFDRAEERKVELMKQAGFNCVRTSHNPVSEAFLNACDRLGLMVIDECFDGWRRAKNKHDYSQLIDTDWQQDISALVLRDRNHPSIICWSIGNEVIERKEIQVISTAHKLASLCRKLDPTRPVTQALAAWDHDWEIYDPLAAEHEVIGYNYLLHKAPQDHIRVPNRIIWQTESYPRDAFSNWALVNDNPYIIGDFVWTAIDYLGESGIGRNYYKGETPGEHFDRDQYPWHGAYCGDIDLTGWRKPISYYRQLLFDRDNAETLHLAVKEPDGYWGSIQETQWSVWPTWDSWNWPGWEGKDIEVEVYAKCPVVQLYLNDSLIGQMPVNRDTQFKAVFKVPYQPGTLRAVGGDCEVTLATAGEPYALRLTSDNRQINANGQDLCFVTVEVIDRHGYVCPNAEVELNCEVAGNASLAALGNANLKELDSTLDKTHRTWKGRALAIVRSTFKAGNFQLTIRSPHLKSSSFKGLSRY